VKVSSKAIHKRSQGGNVDKRSVLGDQGPGARNFTVWRTVSRHEAVLQPVLFSGPFAAGKTRGRRIRRGGRDYPDTRLGTKQSAQCRKTDQPSSSEHESARVSRSC